jgi:hypothetical protein
MLVQKDYCGSILLILYILIGIQMYRPSRSRLLLCSYRCERSPIFIVYVEVFHPVVPGHDSENVLMTRLRYSFSVHMFAVLVVVVSVLAFRAGTTGLRTSTLGNVLKLV